MYACSVSGTVDEAEERGDVFPRMSARHPHFRPFPSIAALHHTEEVSFVRVVEANDGVPIGLVHCQAFQHGGGGVEGVRQANHGPLCRVCQCGCLRNAEPSQH